MRLFQDWRIRLGITLLFLTLLTFIPRMYKFNNPIADWHSWRQADTASMTRNFIREGYTPLLPKFDTYNSLNEYQLPNPKRYFLAEFPIYNTFVYFSYKWFGYFSPEQWGRIVSIISSVFATTALYFLVREYSSQKVAFFSAVFFAILPYNIYYGRVIMADPLHIFFSISTFLFVTLWLKKNSIPFALLAALMYAGALLTKPYALVLLLPLVYLILKHYRFAFFKNPGFYLFALISFAPFLWWRYHIGQYPEGQFGTSWLYNQGNIRFTGAFFRWLIFDRMNRLIFATGGFVLFWLGMIKGNDKKEGLFYYLWLASILIFFTVIAKGNVTHDYYQLPIVPIGCIFMAKGIEFLYLQGHTFLKRLFYMVTAVLLVLLMLAFGWYEIKGYFNINRPEIVAAGKEVDRILPKDAKVIAPYQNDPAFLYQTNRKGWTFGDDKIAQYIKEGATHMVSVNYDEPTNYWMNRCSVVKKNKEFVIIDLKICKKDTLNTEMKK